MNKMFLNVFVQVILKKNCGLFVALVALQNLYYKQKMLTVSRKHSCPLTV